MKSREKKIGKINLRKLLDKKLLLPLLVVTVVVFILSRGGQEFDSIQTVRVEEKTITSEISASGSIKSQTSSTLKFSTAGKIAWIGVEEGNYLNKGQAVASLEKEPFLVALRQAQQDVNAADAVLSQVYDEAKKQTAAENFDQKIRRTNAETTKNKTYDTMRKAEFDLAHTTIYSPQNGVVTNLNFIVGEEVTPASEIAQVQDLENLKFVAEVDETDIGKTQVGQKVKITLDAYPEQAIDATTEQISPVATTTETGATIFEVTASITGESTSIGAERQYRQSLSANKLSYYIGMNGQAQIIIEEKTNTLVIPSDAVTDDKYVRVKAGPTYVQREIKTGLKSDTEVEVIEGLSVGEEIVISGPQPQRPNLLRRIFTR